MCCVLDSIGTHGSRPTSSRVSIGSRRASSQLSVGGSQIPTGNEKLQTTHKIENEIVTPRSPSNKERLEIVSFKLFDYSTDRVPSW